MGWFHFVWRYSYEKIKMQISCNNRLHPAFLFHTACSASPGTGKSLAPLESEAQAVSFAGSERITAYLLRKPQRKLRPIASQPTGIENPSPQKSRRPVGGMLEEAHRPFGGTVYRAIVRSAGASRRTAPKGI